MTLGRALVSSSAIKELPVDRTAVVTGAGSTRGIGRATAHRLGRDGWAIAAVDVDHGGAEEVAREVRHQWGVPAAGFAADIRDEKQVDRAFKEIRDSLPPVVGLVNNAGISSPVPFTEVTAEEWRRVIDVNLNGTFNVTKAAVQDLVRIGVGRIVTVSSTSAERGGGVYGRAAYSASKAGLLGMMRTLARELGPLGITCNSVTPGSIDTDIMGGRLSEERKQTLILDLLVGRVGSVDDVAGLINYLLGPEAGYITGATYAVNGGSHIS